MKSQRTSATIYLVAAASLLIGFCAGYLAGLKDPTPSSRRLPNPALSPVNSSMSPANAAMSAGSQAQSASLTLDAKSVEIAKQLFCVCGCKMELLTCTCEDARGSKEIKLFVQDRVRQDVPESKILEQLVDKYGQGILIKPFNKSK
jgi:cytochrome c-type biogenesis protein CcmH/NrfF